MKKDFTEVKWNRVTPQDRPPEWDPVLLCLRGGDLHVGFLDDEGCYSTCMWKHIPEKRVAYWAELPKTPYDDDVT